MKLYHTDDDVWHGTQVDAKRHAREHNTDYEMREVPTDKPGLIEYLNRIKEPSPVTATQLVPVPARLDPLEAAELRAVARHTGDGTINPIDGQPEAHSAFTPAQVASGTLPIRNEKVQDVCYIISKMAPRELAFVALEVVARAAKVGGIGNGA